MPCEKLIESSGHCLHGGGAGILLPTLRTVPDVAPRLVLINIVGYGYGGRATALRPQLERSRAEAKFAACVSSGHILFCPGRKGANRAYCVLLTARVQTRHPAGCDKSAVADMLGVVILRLHNIGMWLICSLAHEARLLATLE